MSGRCHLYVFPCHWEDQCKLGFSRDPLARLRQLHRRWFEFFDLDRGWLVETETVRDARDLELALRRRLVEHNAAAPLTARHEAGGYTEWYRGAGAQLDAAVAALGADGYTVHALRPWLREALVARSDQLHDWAAAQLTVDELEGLAGSTPAQAHARDVLDAYSELGIDVTPLLPAQVERWYRRG